MPIQHRNKSVSVHDFALNPRADIPRSSFRIETAHKTSFDAGYLVPIYVDEVLPGDSFNFRMTLFSRLQTLIAPIMDNLYMDTFFFFVPSRLVWDNWRKFMGEQANPGDSTSYVIPKVTLPEFGPISCSIYDYFGIPVEGQIGAVMSINALPFRAYNLIYNEWFRDQNLQNSVSVPKGDGPDADTTYTLLRRGKRHDYFTSCLPWTQKGTSVPLPLGSSAPVVASATYSAPTFKNDDNTQNARRLRSQVGNDDVAWLVNSTKTSDAFWDTTGLIADLSSATAATINQIRQSFQIQKLLERDARGGTRYTELIKAHFGVQSPDARLQRPEYLGGGSSHISINPVESTNGTSATGRLAALAANGGTIGNHAFVGSFTEHGYIIGLASVRADLNYQQGLRKIWSRNTRYDFYWPVFAQLGEQAVLRKEIFCNGIPASDEAVFGYQERWAEYRYHPAYITGTMRANAGNDYWHLAQTFVGPPFLNATFIQENPPMQRILNGGALTDNQQFLVDSFISIKAARPIPMYSVPGMVDHF